MRSTIYLPIAWLSALATSAAAQSCTVPPFYSNPAYGPQSGCVPTSYLSAADLGNTNPTDAATRCSQQCSKLSNCGGWVAQLNRSPNGLYSGSCFFYNTLPAAPRSCADKPTELIAGVRDDTPKCFSASKSAATAFCSSFLGIGQKTVTATANTPTVTATTTVTNTSPTTTTTVTTQIDTTTATVTTTTDVATSVTVLTEATTTTVPAAAVQPLTKRAVAPPSCVASGVPASQLSANCQCLSITSATVTSTSTPSASTTTVTSYATATTVIQTTLTTLTTVTVPATATEKTTTLTTTTTTTTIQETANAATCAASVPTSNVLANPGFNDGTLNGWQTFGIGAWQATISTDSQCGAYGVRYTINNNFNVANARMRQTVTIGNANTYRVTVYAKKVSVNAPGCTFYVFCQVMPAIGSSTQSLITSVNQMPETWTPYSVTCSRGADSSASMLVDVTMQCLQTNNAVIGVDEISAVPIDGAAPAG